MATQTLALPSAVSDYRSRLIDPRKLAYVDACIEATNQGQPWPMADKMPSELAEQVRTKLRRYGLRESTSTSTSDSRPAPTKRIRREIACPKCHAPASSYRDDGSAQCFACDWIASHPEVAAANESPSPVIEAVEAMLAESKPEPTERGHISVQIESLWTALKTAAGEAGYHVAKLSTNNQAITLSHSEGRLVVTVTGVNQDRASAPAGGTLHAYWPTFALDAGPIKAKDYERGYETQRTARNHATFYNWVRTMAQCSKGTADLHFEGNTLRIISGRRVTTFIGRIA